MESSTGHPYDVLPCAYNGSKCANTSGDISTNVTNNGTFARNEQLAQIEIAVQSVIFTLAVLGNSTVLASLYCRRRHLSRMHVLMIHLSIADLFVAFGNVLPQLIWDVTFVFYGGDFLCKLVKYMQIVAMYASSYVLVMTAIDRYVAICHPFVSHKWTTRNVHQLVGIAWTLSLVFSLPQLVIFSYKVNSYGMEDCWGTFDPEWTLTFYITSCTVLVYIIPTIILIFCYGSICVVVWRAGAIGERLTRLSLRFRSTNGPSSQAEQENATPTCEPGEKTMDSASKKYSKCVFKKPPDAHGNANGVIQGSDTEPGAHGACNLAYTSDEMATDSVTKPAALSRLLNCFKTRATISNSAQVKQSPEPIRTRTGSESNVLASTISAKHGSAERESMHKLQLSGSGRYIPLQQRNIHRRHSENPNIYRKIASSPSQSYRSTMGRRKSEPTGISRAKIRTVKLTLAVVLCYLVCWSPFFIAQMWAVYDPTAPFYGAAYTIILLLASLNSCTNPWIYLVFSDSACSRLKHFMSSFRNRSKYNS